MFQRKLAILPDLKHSQSEQRFKAIGRGGAGRSIFLVFTLRIRNDETFIRPISARFKHEKEVKHYEKENPGL